MNQSVKREIIVYYKKLGNKVPICYVYSEVSNFLFSDKAFLNEEWEKIKKEHPNLSKKKLFADIDGMGTYLLI